jgi:hypothetical protein
MFIISELGVLTKMPHEKKFMSSSLINAQKGDVSVSIGSVYNAIIEEMKDPIKEIISSIRDMSKIWSEGNVLLAASGGGSIAPHIQHSLQEIEEVR